MNWNKEIIKEHGEHAKMRCCMCDRRIKQEDLEWLVTLAETHEHEEEGLTICPQCNLQTDLYKEDIEQYIASEGYELKDCKE